MSSWRILEIRRRLKAAFDPLELEVIDEGHLHVGHEGAKSGQGHFRVVIVSDQFRGLRRIQAHRLVYDALGTLMQTDIHALSVDASAPAAD
jgi:BolA protein